MGISAGRLFCETDGKMIRRDAAGPPSRPGTPHPPKYHFCPLPAAVSNRLSLSLSPLSADSRLDTFGEEEVRRIRARGFEFALLFREPLSAAPMPAGPTNPGPRRNETNAKPCGSEPGDIGFPPCVPRALDPARASLPGGSGACCPKAPDATPGKTKQI